MLDKKMTAKIAVVILFGTAMALGATNSLVVSGSGTVFGTATEAELLYNGGPNILIITNASTYLFNGSVAVINDVEKNSYVNFSGVCTNRCNSPYTEGPYTANASITGTHNWTLEIYQNGRQIPSTINGYLLVNS